MSGSSSDRAVLASYACGSSVYGLRGSDGDTDMTVIVEGEGIAEIRKVDGTDYFVFSPDYFRKVVSYEAGVLDAFKVWIDNLTLIDETLISLEPSFAGEFREIARIDWDARFEDWLRLNVSYFKSRLEDGCLDKSLYHLYRLHSMVERYESDGVFVSRFSESDLNLARDYKENKSGRHRHLDAFAKIIQYLEEQL